jgi:hypothetical protein
MCLVVVVLQYYMTMYLYLQFRYVIVYFVDVFLVSSSLVVVDSHWFIP